MEESESRRMMKLKKKRREEGEIGYLAYDVLCDVLIRLPVKSLSRFKCVSKGWCNLIEDDNFVKLHFTRSKQNGTGRFLRICTRRKEDCNVAKARFYALDEEEEDDGRGRGLQRVGKVVPFRFPSLPPSCNGLLCYMSSIDNHIKVCNPITRQTITLPDPNFLVQNKVPDFEDLNFSVMLGIGYVSSEDQYKVVAAWSNRIDSDVEIFTLGSSSSSWRPLSSRPYGTLLSHSSARDAGPAYANGALYWYYTETVFQDDYDKYDDSFITRYATEIISFDFAQEKFNHFPIPNDLQDRVNHVCWVFELQGHLCLLERSPSGSTMKMWMLNNSNNHHWVPQNIPPNLFWVGTCSTNQNGRTSIVTQGDHQQKTLHSRRYNCKGQLIKPTKIHPHLRRFYFEVAQFHQESLVSLTSM